MKGPTNIDWDAQPLGECADAVLARALGVPAQAVQYQRNKRNIEPFGGRRRRSPVVDWDAQPLGKMSDNALALQLGMSPGGVTRERRRRGIPSFQSQHRSAIDWDSQPLGKVSDGEVARSLGVALGQVREARLVRGIAPFNLTSSPASDLPAPRVERMPDMSYIRKELSLIRGLLEEVLSRIHDSTAPAGFPEDIYERLYRGAVRVVDDIESEGEKS